MPSEAVTCGCSVRPPRVHAGSNSSPAEEGRCSSACGLLVWGYHCWQDTCSCPLSPTITQEITSTCVAARCGCPLPQPLVTTTCEWCVTDIGPQIWNTCGGTLSFLRCAYAVMHPSFHLDSDCVQFLRSDLVSAAGVTRAALVATCCASPEVGWGMDTTCYMTVYIALLLHLMVAIHLIEHKSPCVRDVCASRVGGCTADLSTCIFGGVLVPLPVKAMRGRVLLGMSTRSAGVLHLVWAAFASD